MEGKVSKLATKLITRSKTKTSKSHKKIVTMLNNLSKDKTGAPVKWKFNKSGVKQANKVGKRLKTAEEKGVQSTTSSDNTDTDSIHKSDVKLDKTLIKNSEHLIQKKKPGRPKIIKSEKEADLNPDVSIERLQDGEISGEIIQDNNEEHFTKVNEISSQNNSQKSNRGRKKKILSKDIRIKRLQILKRHIEKGKGKGPIRKISDLHSKLTSEKSSDCNSDEMEESSSVNINHEKLKLLKQQIDSERKRGRGNSRRGRGRWKDIPSFVKSTSVNQTSFSGIASTSGAQSIVKNVSERGRRGRRPWKHISSDIRVHENIKANSTAFIVADRTWKRGRPPKRGRGARWTSLNRQALTKSALNEEEKGKGDTVPLSSQISDAVVDSECESIDSNLSSASSKAKKRKMFQSLGIKLGPAKLLRSQDSMKTRTIKDSSGQTVPKKRKRTLSGEFDLLDEVSLRKQMRGKDDDDTSTVKSFDDCWADVTDSELNDSQNNTQGDITQSDNENSYKIETKPKVKTYKVHSFQRVKKLEIEGSREKDIKVPRRKGRPPKILKEEYELNFRKTAKHMDHYTAIRRNHPGRLTIIGPGGIQFIKVNGTKKSDFDSTSIEKSIDDKKLLLKPEEEGDIIGEIVVQEQPKYNNLKQENVQENDVMSESNIKTETIKDEVDRESFNKNVSGEIQSPSVISPVDSKTESITENAIILEEKKDTASDNFTEEILSDTNISSLKQVKDDEPSSEIPVLSPKPGENFDGSNETISTAPLIHEEQIVNEDNDQTEIEQQESKNILVVTVESITENVPDEKLDETSESFEMEPMSDNENDDRLSNIEMENKIYDKQEKSEKSGEITCINEDNISKEDETDVTDVQSVDKDFMQPEIISTLDSTNVENEINTDELVKKIDEITGVSTNDKPFGVYKLADENVKDHEKINIGESDSLTKEKGEPEMVVSDILLEIIHTICGKFENIQSGQMSTGTNISESIDQDDKLQLLDDKCSLVEDIDTVNQKKENKIINSLSDNVTSGNEDQSKSQHDKNKLAEVKNLEESDKNCDVLEDGEQISEKQNDIDIDKSYNEDTVLPQSKEEITNTEKSVDDSVDTAEKKVESETTVDTEISKESQQLPSTSQLSTEITENIAKNTESSETKVKKRKRKETDSESRSSTQESNSTTTPDKTETKRVFQLRKKTSRSPLEIIAMKHSMEERQYMLEETQRAIRREEKQKKMVQNKLLRQAGEQISPPKQTPDQLSPQKQVELVQHPSSDIAEESSSESIINQCKPCSIVLVDLVKYLKMNEQSDKPVTDLDDLSTTEDEWMTDTETQTVKPIAQSKTESTASESDTSRMQTTSLGPNLEPGKITVQEPVKKTNNKARKQAKSYNYSSKLMAEIVSSPDPVESDTKSFTVPPLRLKIKQKERIKKRYKGHKWTAPRNKARKQMSPARLRIAHQKFEFETLGSNDNVYEFEDSPEKVAKLDGMTDASSVSTNVTTESVSVPSNISQNSSGNSVGSVSTDSTFRYKCNHKNCEFKSQTRNMIESHIYIHLKDTPFKCAHCEGIFESRNNAFNHSKTKHPDKEPKIMTVDTVDETKFYDEMNTQQRTENSSVIQADIADVQHSSESLIISVRLPRNISDGATTCFCCCHCDFSSSKIQDINTHVEENHRESIQYLCSVCNKAVYRHGEGIARHFSVEHPDLPVAYKSLADFYDVRKTIEKPTNGDKGNIFDRMSDLFSGGRSPDKGTKTIPDKTSAEADSTTADHDPEDETMKIQPNQVKKTGGAKVVETFHHEPDGIEQLAQIFGPPSSVDGDKRESNNRNATFGEKSNSVLEDTSGNDMGLKIVDVVSLQDANDFAKNVWGDSAVGVKPTVSFQNPIPVQVNQRPPVLIPTSAIQQSLVHMNRPILPMPQRMPLGPSGNIDAAKLKEVTTTYKCEKCNVHAPVLSAMVEHLRTGHKEIPRLFLCPYCRQYEGATEPDIHKHIKQFHPSPNTRSPPVALSSDAKQHLRTIEVPVGDTQKVNGKYLMEKDIYKCLKCKRHMPSLDYIYEHLEKEHNEVFVYVCPDCKRFRDKEEEVVYNHIKTVHNKNTDDIILSLAIEENLFTRVQCLTKDKSAQNKSQLQKQIPPPLSIPSNQNQQVQNLLQSSVNRPQQMPVFRQRQPLQQTRPAMQPVFPGMIQNRPVRMPGPVLGPTVSHSQPVNRPVPPNQPVNRPVPPNQPMNKSSMRKSRPVHIPQNIDNIPTPHTVQHFPSEGRNFIQHSTSDVRRLSSPPPLMRGPPPLIRFQGGHGNPKTSVQNSSVVSANYGMAERVQRLHQNQPNSHVQSMASNVSPPPQNRPVLKVPSFNRRTSAASPGSSSAEGFHTEERAPLDLSRNTTPNSQTGEDVEDMSPDAFQIFNIQPMRQQTPHVNQPHYSQTVPSQQQRHQNVGSYNPSMYNRQGAYNQMYRPPPPYSQHVAGPHSRPVMVNQQQAKLLKCPYCPHLVPLSMSEVRPHIEKYHPGQKILFVKKD